MFRHQLAVDTLCHLQLSRLLQPIVADLVLILHRQFQVTKMSSELSCLIDCVHFTSFLFEYACIGVWRMDGDEVVSGYFSLPLIYVCTSSCYGKHSLHLATCINFFCVGVSVDGRHIPPAILAPLQNPPKFPVQIPTSHPKESCLRRHKKKKVKEYERGSSGWLRRNCIDKDIGVTHSPSQDALSLLPPQRHIADLHTHPAKDRNRSSAISCPKFALSPPVCLRSR